MRLLNHRTTSIAREGRLGMEVAGAKPSFTERLELLPGYKPHLSYRSPLRGFAYNKSGKRGYRADQVTGGMNRNTLTQKAPSALFSSPMEHSTNPILSGEIRNLALRCSSSSLKHPSSSNPLHKERFKEHPNGFGMAVPDSWHMRRSMGPPGRACTRHPVFSENPAPSGDIRTAPANNPEHTSSGQLTDTTQDGFGLRASHDVRAGQLPLKPHRHILQSAPGLNTIQSIPSPEGEFVPSALGGANTIPIFPGTVKTGTNATIHFTGAIHPVIGRIPRLPVPPIQGMILGAANALGFFANMVRSEGHIKGNMRRTHAEHEPPANTAEAPKDVPIAPPIAVRPGLGSRARKTVHLMVAMAGNPPPQ